MSGSPVYLRRLERGDLDALSELRLRNREFLQPFEPLRPESFWTLAGQERDLDSSLEASVSDRGFAFGIFEKDTDEMVGRIALSNVSRGAWQNATVGYFIDQAHQGRGYATEAVRWVLRWAFDELRLHRVQAGVMPRNVASARVLEKAGFRLEGRSPRYLCINGTWEDHDMYAVTIEEAPPGS
jgi:ribosomal-protein-alanine N-acetyltransferase